MNDMASPISNDFSALKMEALGRLTGGIAHDFNNLLGVIIGNLDIAANHAAFDPAMRDYLQEALNGALRGAELTRQLLAFSRNQPLQPAVIDVNHSLSPFANMLSRTLWDAIAVELLPGAGLWPTRVDPAQFDEVILNLAINARDAMPNGGKLVIETRNARFESGQAEVDAGDYVQISVRDTGTGMTAEAVERCCEPFFTTKETEKGSGLGLSMVYGFAKQSGGHIKIDSALGQGTGVRITLPRASASAADASAPCA